MNSLESDIVSLYDQGLNTTQIFNELEGQIDEVAIKYVLGQYSKSFRSLQKQNDRSPAPAPQNGSIIDELDKTQRQSVDVISDEDHNEICNVIRNLAIESEDEYIRLRAAKFLFEEKTGRAKALVRATVKSKLPVVNINILQINEDLKKGRARLAMIESQLEEDANKQAIAI